MRVLYTIVEWSLECNPNPAELQLLKKTDKNKSCCHIFSIQAPFSFEKELSVHVNR